MSLPDTAYTTLKHAMAIAATGNQITIGELAVRVGMHRNSISAHVAALKEHHLWPFDYEQSPTPRSLEVRGCTYRSTPEALAATAFCGRKAGFSVDVPVWLLAANEHDVQVLAAHAATCLPGDPPPESPDFVASRRNFLRRVAREVCYLDSDGRRTVDFYVGGGPVEVRPSNPTEEYRLKMLEKRKLVEAGGWVWTEVVTPDDALSYIGPPAERKRADSALIAPLAALLGRHTTFSTLTIREALYAAGAHRPHLLRMAWLGPGHANIGDADEISEDTGPDDDGESNDDLVLG